MWLNALPRFGHKNCDDVAFVGDPRRAMVIQNPARLCRRGLRTVGKIKPRPGTESCDGVDMDCDELIDSEDPDCT